MLVSGEDVTKFSRPSSRTGGWTRFAEAVAGRWAMIGAGMAFGLLAGIASLSAGPASFTAEARVHVAGPQAVRTEQGAAAAAAESAQTQTGLILSRDIARTAIRDLGLTLETLDPEEVATPMQRMLRFTGLSRPPRDVPAEDRLMAAFTERVSVRPAGVARQISIGFTSHDAALAVRAANQVAALYVDLLAHPDASNVARDVRLVSAAVLTEPAPERAPRSVLAGFTLFGLSLSVGLASLKEWRKGRSGAQPGPDPERSQGFADKQLMERAAEAVNEDRRADFSSPLPESDQLAGAEVPNFARESAVVDMDGVVARICEAGATAYARRILVTHIEPDVDCAMTALLLARALCVEGRVVLVGVGAGDRAEAVHERRPAPGLSDLIDGTASFSEVIHRDRGTRLHILPSGRGLSPAGADLDLVLDALSQTYDHVVLSATLDADQPARKIALALAPEADFVALACSNPASSSETMELRGELIAAGAGEVLAIRAAMLGQKSKAA